MHPLTPYGWSDRVAALVADAGPADPGRVVRVDAHRTLVVTTDGTVALPSSPATTGDWVMVGDDHVVAVLPRWSSLVRRGADDAPQVLAADVDVVLIVAPLDRPPNPNRIERELVVVWDGGAVPVVVLSKADVAPDDGAAAARLKSAGVDVLTTSAVTGEGVDAIRSLLRPDRTAALLGPSGAGKSTLVNAIVGSEALATGDVRAGDNKGRHTTTARHLVPVPGGGVLLDTPGLRSVGLWDAEGGIDLAFPDVAELAAACKFGDCAHDTEPGCAVVGGIDADRLASWRTLRKEAVAEERRSDPRVRARARREVKAVERSMRRYHGR